MNRNVVTESYNFKYQAEMSDPVNLLSVPFKQKHGKLHFDGRNMSTNTFKEI